MDDKERKARQALRRLFKDFTGTVMSRDDALAKIGLKTFQNFTGVWLKRGLAEYDRDEGLGRKILTIRLTPMGKQAVAEQPTVKGTEIIDPLTNLDALGEFVEKFNSRNKYWELRLERKEAADHR